MELGRIIFRGEEVWRAYKNREIIWHQKKLKFFSAKDIEIFALSCCELKNESTDSIHSQFGMLIDLEWLSFFLDRSKNVGRKTSADILENFQINSDLTKIRQADNIFSVLDDWRLNPSTSGKIEKRLPILNINSWSLFLDESAILKKTEEIELYLKNLFALFPTKKIEKKERITSVYLKNCFASLAKPEWIKASISSLSLIQLANGPTREIEKKEQINFNIIKKFNVPGIEYIQNNNTIQILLNTKQNFSLVRELTKKDGIIFSLYLPLRDSPTKIENSFLCIKHNLNAKTNCSFVKEYDKTWLIINNYYINVVFSKIKRIRALESASVCIERFPVSARAVRRKTQYGSQKVGISLEYKLFSSEIQEIIKRHTLALLKHINFYVREKKELSRILKNQVISESPLFDSLAVYSLLNKNVLGENNNTLFNSESRLGHYQKILAILSQSDLNTSFAFEFYLKRQIALFWNEKIVNNTDAELKGIFCTKKNKETSSLAILERLGKTEELKFIVSEKNCGIFGFQTTNAPAIKTKLADYVKANFGMSTSLKEICSLVQKRMKSYFYLILDGNLHSFQGMAATHSRENVLLKFLDFLGYFTFNANDEIEAKLVEGVTKRGERNLAFKTVKENILCIKKRQRFVLQKDFSFLAEGRLGISQFILLYLSTDFLIQNKTDFSTSVFENLQIFYKTINASHNLLFLDSVYRMISYLEGSACIKYASVLASTTKKFIDPLELPVSCLDALSVLSFSDDYHWLYPERRDINNLYIQQVYNFSYSNKNIR